MHVSPRHRYGKNGEAHGYRHMWPYMGVPIPPKVHSNIKFGVQRGNFGVRRGNFEDLIINIGGSGSNIKFGVHRGNFEDLIINIGCSGSLKDVIERRFGASSATLSF